MTETRNITPDLEAQLQRATEALEKWTAEERAARARIDQAANQKLYWSGRADVLRELVSGIHRAAPAQDTPPNESAPETTVPVSPTGHVESAKPIRRPRSPKK